MSMRTPKLENLGVSKRTGKRPPTDDRNRAEEARKRLGVDSSEVLKCRKITPSLRECGLTRERVIEILDADDQEDSLKFMEKYRSISDSDLPCLTIEEITIAAGLTTRRLWELVQGARLEQSHDAVKMLISDNRAKVMAVAIKAATEERPIIGPEGEVVGWNYGDVKAIELIWKADGTLPQAKGTSIILNQRNNAGSAQEEAEDALPLADMDSVLKEIQRITATPQLPAPKEIVTVPIIEAEYEEVPIGVLSR